MPSTRRQMVEILKSRKRSTRSSAVGTFDTKAQKNISNKGVQSVKNTASSSRHSPRKQKLYARDFDKILEEIARGGKSSRQSPRKQKLCPRKFDSVSENLEEIVEGIAFEKVSSDSTKRGSSQTSIEDNKDGDITKSKTSSISETERSVETRGTKRAPEDTIDKPLKRVKKENNEKKLKKTVEQKVAMAASSESFSPRRSSREVIPNRRFKDLDLEFPQTRRKRQQTPQVKEDKKSIKISAKKTVKKVQPATKSEEREKKKIVEEMETQDVVEEIPTSEISDMRKCTVGTETADANTSTTDINTSTTDINTCNTDINTSTTDVNTSTTDINSFTTDINTSNTDINTSNTNINTSTTDINTSTTDINTSNTDIKTSTTDINTSTTDINTSTTDINTSTTYINTSTTDINTSNTDIKISTTDINTSTTDINTSTADINTSTTDINTSNTDINTSNTDINIFTTDINTSNTDINTSPTKINKYTTDINECNKNKKVSATDISSSGKDISTSATDISLSSKDINLATINNNSSARDKNSAIKDSTAAHLENTINSENFKHSSSLDVLSPDSVEDQRTETNSLPVKENESMEVTGLQPEGNKNGGKTMEETGKKEKEGKTVTMVSNSTASTTENVNRSEELNTKIEETNSLETVTSDDIKSYVIETPQQMLSGAEVVPSEVTISECGEIVYEGEGGLVTEVVTITTVEGEEADAIVGAVKQSGGLSLQQEVEKGDNSEGNSNREVKEGDQNMLELIEISGIIGSENLQDNGSTVNDEKKDETNVSSLPGSVVQKVTQTSSQIKVKILNTGDVEDSGKIITIDAPNRKSGMSSSSTQTPIMVSSRIADLPGRFKKSSAGPQIRTITVKVPKPGTEGTKEGEIKEGGDQKQEFVIVHLPEGIPVKRQLVKEGKDEAVPFYQEEDGTFVCGVCSYRTQKKANWYKHKKKHMTQKPHECPKCHYKAATSSNLKRHLAIHDDIREYQCSVCMMTFRQKIHLIRHIKYRHEEKKVRCPLCDYVCANENPDLKIHIKRRHLAQDGEEGAVQAFACEECGLMTVSKKDLRQHLKFHRRGPELKLFCEQCSFVTDCESRLRRHMFIHTNEKPFQCGLCDYRGSQKEHVLRHLKSQHKIAIQKKQRSTEESSVTSSTEDNSFDKKMEKLDYSNQEKIFACNHCSMKFAKLLNLYKHLHAQHKGILPPQRDDEFLCVVCDYRTCNKKNLLVHMRKHNFLDQGPPSHVYSCVLCHYLNPKRRNLFQHMKKKHNIEIVMKDDGSTSCFVEDNETSLSQIQNQSVENILTVGDVVTTSTEESQLQIVTEDSGKDAVQVQNVISIEDLAYAVSHPQPNNQSNVVILEQALSGLSHSTSQGNAVMQPEAAEAIEGLQALAEQPGILECQEIITDHDQIDHHTLTIDEISSSAENMETEVVTMGTDLDTPIGAADILKEEKEPEIEVQTNIQLSAEQLMNLSTGDYVEINGEMYKVEISSEETANEAENDGQEGNSSEGPAAENTVFLQKVKSAEITTDSAEIVEEFEQLVQNQEQTSEILKIHPENVFPIEGNSIIDGEILEEIKTHQADIAKQKGESLLTSSGPANVMTVVGQVTNTTF